MTSPELIPRHVPLDKKQYRALGALRMRVPGKSLEFRTSPDSRALAWLKGRVLEPAAEESDPGLSFEETTAQRFLSKNIAVLALEDANSDLAFLRSSKDSTQRKQLRYQQRHDGLNVWGREVLVQLDPHGNVELMVGAYVPSPEGVQTIATLSEEDAIKVAREHIASLSGRVTEQELLIYAPDGGDESLAYRCSIHDTLVNHWDVFVDARSGQVLHQSSQICTAHATGSGQDNLGQTRNLNFWRHTDGNYFMIDTTKSMYDPTSPPPNFNLLRGAIVVRDANNAGFENQFGPNIIENEITFSTSSNPTSGWTKHAVDGALNMGRVYNFYLQRFNRNSLDNTGLGLEDLVNSPAANA